MSTDWLEAARHEVQRMRPYQAGKPVEEAQRELGLDSLVKLASNECPHPPSPAVLEAIQKAARDGNRYPDSNGYYLKRRIAEKLGVEPGMITLGNGSNDVLELVASAYLDQQCSAVYSEFAFVVYSLAVLRSGARANVAPAKNFGHDLDAMLACVDDDTRVVYLANPNNPTGTYVGDAALKVFLDAIDPRVIVVLDEAYTEYVKAADYPDGIALQRDYPNLVVTRTFSKAYGLGGLRVGYAVSHPQIADAMNRVREPFNVSSVALAAAEAALGDDAALAMAIATNDAGMQQIVDGLAQLGHAVIPSVGNFVTFSPFAGTGGIGASEVNDALLRGGVIVRPLANYRMQGYLRVSVGLPEENALFLEQMKKLSQGQE